MAEYEKGRAVSSSRRKVAEALDEWLTRIEHSIKPSMTQNWRNYAAYYVIPYIGQREVQDIDRRRLRRAVRQAARRGPGQGQAEEAANHASCARAAARARRAGAAVPPVQL